MKSCAAFVDLMIAEAKTFDIENSALLDRYADSLFYLLLTDHVLEKIGFFGARMGLLVTPN